MTRTPRRRLRATERWTRDSGPRECVDKVKAAPLPRQMYHVSLWLALWGCGRQRLSQWSREHASASANGSVSTMSAGPPTGHRPRAHPAARSVALKDQNKLAGGVPKDTPFQRLRRPGRVEFDNRNNRVAVLRRKFRCCSAYTKRRTDETIEVRC